MAFKDWFGHACTRTQSGYHKKHALRLMPPKGAINMPKPFGLHLLKLTIIIYVSFMQATPFTSIYVRKFLAWVENIVPHIDYMGGSKIGMAYE